MDAPRKKNSQGKYISSPRSIYKAVYEYCLQKGLIGKLQKQILTPECKRFKKQKISEEGLHLLDAVHCVYDKKRTMIFLEEIDKYVTAKSIVIEAGLGTGILSHFAAIRAKSVYGIELNPKVLNLAKSISDFLIEKRLVKKPIHFSLEDATTIQLPIKADILISENIYTGMFFEKQVQITEHLRKYLKRGGSIIPECMNSYIAPAKTSFKKIPEHRELFVPIESSTLKPTPLAKPVKYDELSFKKNLSKGPVVDIEFMIGKAGYFNSIIICSEVIMPSGRVIGRDETIFLNNDIVLAVTPGLMVMKGDKVRVQLSYLYGSSPKTAKLKASILV